MGLKPAAAALFEQFVMDAEDGHFSQTDVPLLASLGRGDHVGAMRRPSLKKIRGGLRPGSGRFVRRGCCPRSFAADAAKPRQRSRCGPEKRGLFPTKSD